MLFKLLNSISRRKSTFKLIVGDFNYPEIDWLNSAHPPSCDNFMNTILDLCLVQHVLEPTRGENILDLIFSQHPETVANVHILEPLKTSDHQMVLCDLNFNTIAPTNCSSTSNLPLSDINFKKADWNHFNELLLQIKWERILQSDSIDDLWNNFAEVITEAVLLSAPKKMHHSPRNALWETTVKCPNFRLKPYFSQKQNCNIYFQRGLTVRDFLNILQSKLHHSLVVRFVVKHPAVANQGASG